MAGPSRSLTGGNLIATKYRLLGRIGEGSFGVICLGKDVESGEQVAMKIEPQRTSQVQTLLEEGRLLKTLQSAGEDGIAEGFPRVFWCGQEGKNNIIVMELLGPSLDQLLQKVAGKFSLKTVIQLADQMIDRIQFVHENDYLHRDIKPENFLIGQRGKANQVYLIDFGLAKKYRDKRVRHIRFRQTQNCEITGTTRYASVNGHKGMELSRRDDLEAIGYVLVLFCKGSLPWQGLQARNDQDRYKKITEKKLSLSVESICRGLPDEFVDYLNYCRGLKFEEQPDYEYLKRLFVQLAGKLEIKYDGLFDWSETDHAKVSNSESEQSEIT